MFEDEKMVIILLNPSWFFFSEKKLYLDTKKKIL